METGEHFIGKGYSSLEHMNSGLETCRKDAFRLYSTVYKDSVFYHLLWHLNIVEEAGD